MSSAPLSPSCRLKAGMMSATRIPAPKMSVRARCRMSADAVRPQAPVAEGARCGRRNGTRRALTRSPSNDRMAGRRVSAAATATNTTRIMPRPMLMEMERGTMSMPVSAMTTVRPLTSTARLAVAAELPMASTTLAPAARSSRKREMMKSV